MPDTGQGMPRPLPPRYPAEIRQIERLTPRVVRLPLGSPELAAFQPAAPGSHIKLILPPPETVEVAQPIRYDGISPVFAAGTAPPFLRTYTPLRFNPVRHELEVELLDHGNSPASNWTRRAKPGQRIIVAGPRGGWEPPLDGDWYLVMADDTGIPAAVQVLQALAPRPRAAIFEVADAAERRPLPGIADTLSQWLHQTPPPRPPYHALPGQMLDDAVRKLQFPPGRVYMDGPRVRRNAPYPPLPYRRRRPAPGADGDPRLLETRRNRPPGRRLRRSLAPPHPRKPSPAETAAIDRHSPNRYLNRQATARRAISHTAV